MTKTAHAMQTTANPFHKKEPHVKLDEYK